MSAAPPSGIYVRALPDTIDPALREGLAGLGFRLADASAGGGLGAGVEASITALACGWSRIEVHGDGDAHHPVLSVLNDNSLETVACRWDPARSEFSYIHFRLGSAVESFTAGGSALGDMKFASEVRRVPLREVVDPAVFMARSLARLGIGGAGGPEPQVRIRFSPPRRSGWLRALLGAAWSGD